MILLDTHYFLWMMEGHDKVTKNPSLLKEITKRIAKREILVSEISLWETSPLGSHVHVGLENGELNDLLDLKTGKIK